MTETAATASRNGVQACWFAAAAVAIAGIFAAVAVSDGRLGLLFCIGLGLGLSLYHGAFGFSAAYRKAFRDGDVSAVAAHAVMLAAAIVLFAPVLGAGSFLGQPVGGAVAPVDVGMVFGAFLFGIGMQLAGGCASGTLYTTGGGSPRMLAVLIFFCLGGFWASLHLAAWQALPGIGAVSLGEVLGWPMAAATQLALLLAIWLAVRAAGGRVGQPLWWRGPVTAAALLRGPWPLIFTALALAILNWLTLIVAGHPWSITWAFALWTAKVAVAVGWDPSTSAFWSGGFQQAALARPILADTVSVMNIGIVLGAFAAAALAGRLAPRWRAPARSWVAAIVGGLALGYGARLAYGCNIGAFFSGVASGSLHGWVWIAAALAGTAVGVRLRPWFRLPA